MDDTPPAAAVQVATAADGSRLHLVDLTPEALPPVRQRDLVAAWGAAHAAARAATPGVRRGFGFRRPDGALTMLALADSDAGCWVQGVERTVDLGNLRGVAICVRLLALIELLTRDRSLVGLMTIEAGDANLHPALLRAAATVELNAYGRFDLQRFRRELAYFRGIASIADGVPA